MLLTPHVTQVHVGRGRWRAVSAALVCTLALAGCAGEAEPTPTVTSTVTPDAEAAKALPPEPAVPPTWPLTGVFAADQGNRPALAVKIENSREARPQTGLELADVVWEEVVEGGVTRYIAVYHSQVPDTLGPVRSVRPMDAHIIAPLAGPVAFSGGQPPFVQLVRDVGLQVLSHDEGAGGFYRTKDRRAPHNVYARTPDLFAAADAGHSAPPSPQFQFARDEAGASAVTAGTPANEVSLTMSTYSSPSWAWDAAAGVFQRSEGAAPAVSSDGTRLTAENVVVLSVAVFDTPFKDPSGTPVPETEVIGSGDALVASGGHAIAATWSKESTAAPVSLTATDGTPLTLSPGNTWVELVPRSSGSYSTR